jgi:hypothetical protein
MYSHIDGDDARAPGLRLEFRQNIARARKFEAHFRHVARYSWLPLPREPE